jgi:hypothetical protein
MLVTVRNKEKEARILIKEELPLERETQAAANPHKRGVAIGERNSSRGRSHRLGRRLTCMMNGQN